MPAVASRCKMMMEESCAAQSRGDVLARFHCVVQDQLLMRVREVSREPCSRGKQSLKTEDHLPIPAHSPVRTGYDPTTDIVPDKCLDT